MSQTSQKTLSPLAQQLVEEFGTLYEAYGLQRLKGLLVGLLLTQDAPVSLDEMAELLGRSKGPISSAVRALADAQLVRKTNGPLNRRDYYVAHPDLFYNNFRFNMTIVRRNRQLAERYLAQLAGQSDIAPERMAENLEHMRAFYDLMEGFYEDFSARWEETRQRLDRD